MAAGDRPLLRRLGWFPRRPSRASGCWYCTRPGCETGLRDDRPGPYVPCMWIMQTPIASRRGPAHRHRGWKLLVSVAVAAAAAISAGTGAAHESAPLWVSMTPMDGARQLLVVVDQQRRSVAVYHLDAATGVLTLRSTRSIDCDLAVEDFNAAEPKPAALRKMLEIDHSGPAMRPSTPPQIVPAPR